MFIAIIVIFILGYACIALEHNIRIDKAASALLMCGAIWTVYTLCVGIEEAGQDLVHHLGETCETLFFLIGAMTIVDIIDKHGGFSLITENISTKEKNRLVWILIATTFFMSAVLDNMTTTIIMVMVLRRLIQHKPTRWVFIGIVIIAANSGGAWSPIGDVTTIMLWMRGNITAPLLVEHLLVPCIVSVVIPGIIVSRMIKAGNISQENLAVSPLPEGVGKKFRMTVLILGVAGLLFVPVYKAWTGLPPYLGIMISLGILWVVTEIVYNHKTIVKEERKQRVSRVIHNIDLPTILFFLGILMAVAGLQSVGILSGVAQWLDTNVHEVFTITGVVGVLSSIVDNVPLVAACMGMYPIADAASIAASADPAYMSMFVQDGLFWELLTYCAGVGGSMLIIGSAAGVVAMGLDKINFVWYLKKITWMAFLGYVAGIGVIYLQTLIF